MHRHSEREIIQQESASGETTQTRTRSDQIWGISQNMRDTKKIEIGLLKMPERLKLSNGVEEIIEQMTANNFPELMKNQFTDSESPVNI